MYRYGERWLFMGPLNSSNRRSNPSLYFHFILRPTAATETDGERERDGGRRRLPSIFLPSERHQDFRSRPFLPPTRRRS